MDNKEWPDLIEIVHSVLDNLPYRQRSNVCPVKALLGRNSVLICSIFLRTATTEAIAVSKLQFEPAISVQELVKLCVEFNPQLSELADKENEASPRACYQRSVARLY